MNEGSNRSNFDKTEMKWHVDWVVDCQKWSIMSRLFNQHWILQGGKNLTGELKICNLRFSKIYSHLALPHAYFTGILPTRPSFPSLPQVDPTQYKRVRKQKTVHLYYYPGVSVHRFLGSTNLHKLNIKWKDHSRLQKIPIKSRKGLGQRSKVRVATSNDKETKNTNYIFYPHTPLTPSSDVANLV